MVNKNEMSADNGDIAFNAEELTKLREVLRISLGKHVDRLSDEDLSDIGSTMLRVTAIVLKAKHSHTNVE